MPKKKNESKHKYTFLIWLITGGLVIFALAGIYLWLVARSDLYIADKSYVEDKTKQALNAVSGLTPAIYSSFKDSGCTTGDIGWLGTSIGCGFQGEQYFKASGDATSNIKAVSSRLQSQGLILSKDDVGRSTDAVLEEFTAIKGGGELSYSSHKDHVTVFLYLFKNDPERPSLTAHTSFGTQINVSLNSNEYIYGLSADGGYWSCSITSFFQWPCPSPPSTPVRR